MTPARKFVCGWRRPGRWSARALVCPAAFRHKPAFEVAARYTAPRGWPLHLRPTDGGAVPQGPGVLNLALAFAASADFVIVAGYRLFTDVIRDALGQIGPRLATGDPPNSFCDGSWSLSLAGRKLVGTAQRTRPAGGGARRVLANALVLKEEDLGPSVEALNRLHADLGLPPITDRARTTLAKEMGRDAPDPAGLARDLAPRAAGALAPTSAVIAA